MKWLMGLLFLGLTCSGALACDHPGTPSHTTAQAIYSDVVTVTWTNTASEGPHTDMWYMIEEQNGPVTRVDMGNIDYGQQATTDVTGLLPNKYHCFRVWARDDNVKGCRSKVPSAYACAFTNPKLGLAPPQARPVVNGPIGVCVVIKSGGVSTGGPSKPCN